MANYHCKPGTYILHREDGPAIEGADYQCYYLNGERHREGGQPAVISHGHGLEWWVHGQLHREDGPAINGPKTKEWWINGQKIPVKSPAEFEQWKRFKAFL